ncbi:hypothetical protein [Rhizobium sp. RAF56]|jgi:hypothetical protein|uniref:hypothetical protein n=1 Tax=Rhizobium sp. RAF56 TaxID=3233062 RepID=UPI003F9589FD
MTPNFIRDLKERFDRLLSPPLDKEFSNRNSGEGSKTSPRGEAEDSLLDYERYHWGSGAGQWY